MHTIFPRRKVPRHPLQPLCETLHPPHALLELLDEPLALPLAALAPLRGDLALLVRRRVPALLVHPPALLERAQELRLLLLLSLFLMSLMKRKTRNRLLMS